MPARLTAKQAKQLGLPGVEKTTPRKKGKKRDRSQVPSKDCTPTRCVTCGYTTNPAHGEADEARHVGETGHCRFECVLEVIDAGR